MAIGQLADAMLKTALATTRRLATDTFDFGKRGDEKRLGQSDLFEPAGEHATDIAGMALDTHEGDTPT
jgi:hypothetical protein